MRSFQARYSSTMLVGVLCFLFTCTALSGCGREKPPVNAEATKALDPSHNIELLKSKDAGSRLLGARRLGRLGSNGHVAIPELTRVSQTDKDANVRQAAAAALKSIQDGK